MGKLLDATVAARVNAHYDANLPDDLKAEREFMLNAAQHAIADEIRKEILSEYGQEVRLKIQEEEKEKQEITRMNDSLKKMRSLLFESLFVAVIVGVLVNQVTDIISYLKESQPAPPYASTFGICLFLLVILCVIVGIHTFNAIADVLTVWKSTKSDEQNNRR